MTTRQYLLEYINLNKEINDLSTLIFQLRNISTDSSTDEKTILIEHKLYKKQDEFYDLKKKQIHLLTR